MRSFLPVEFGMHGDNELEGQTVGRGQAASKDDANNKATLDLWAILNGDIASLNESLLLGIPLAVDARAAPEERDESLGPPLSQGGAKEPVVLTRMYRLQ